MENIILQTTADGSHTLFLPALNEHYHSTHGAIQESELVFIQNGLRYMPADLHEINLLEVGFGTGLNALLAVLEAKKQRRRINYIAVEPTPVSADLIEKLNFPLLTGSPEAAGYFHKIHKAGWEYPSFLSDYFIISKLKAKLEEVRLSDGRFHLVFFDAFGPDVQPELWTEEIFSRVYHCLAPGGILVTYSCKGNVKRALKATGFTIEKLPGPAGKREVLRATKRA